jgi:hypothetical protein
MSNEYLDQENAKFNFFQAVKNANEKEVIQYFRNERVNPWEFKEEEEYSGNFKLNIKHYIGQHSWIYLT